MARVAGISDNTAGLPDAMHCADGLDGSEEPVMGLAVFATLGRFRQSGAEQLLYRAEVQFSQDLICYLYKYSKLMGISTPF